MCLSRTAHLQQHWGCGKHQVYTHTDSAMVTSSTKAYLIRRQDDCIAHVREESVEV